MKHYAHKVYFFKNSQIIVLYKLYFFKTYFMIYDDFLKLNSDFKLVATSAHAEALDMSDATTQLALGLAAVGAIGAAKLAPAALTWVWSLVTGAAKRN